MKEVSFEAYWGEMLYIVGPSGSGKTTLLSMISGILRPNAGSVTIDGQDLWSQSDDEIADFRLNTIGFVFQDYHLFPRLTTAENVAIPLILQRRSWDEALRAAAIDTWRSSVSATRRSFRRQARAAESNSALLSRARSFISPRFWYSTNRRLRLTERRARKIVSFVKTEILTAQRCISIVTHDDQDLRVQQPDHGNGGRTDNRLRARCHI